MSTTGTDNVEIAREFFAAIYRLDFDAVVEFFTEDGSYHDLPIPTDPTVGKTAIRAKFQHMIAGGVERMSYNIFHIMGDGDVVLCERDETWHFPSGAEPKLRVMCTIEFREGKIARWREYWNQSELMDAMPPEFFAGVAAAMADET